MKTGLNYLVCASPRSGSSLLCEALAATGVAGRPSEYLESAVAQKCCAAWGVPPPGSTADYLRLLHEHARTANGVLGIKVMYGALKILLKSERVLPGLRYVRILRRDVIRQAVSHLRALQTAHWSSAQAEETAPQAEPHYDFALLDELVQRTHRQAAKWDRFFTEAGATPATVHYEDLVADQPGAVRAVLDHLGIAAPEPLFRRPITLRRQGDSLNEEWIARYLADPAREAGGG